MQRPRNRAGFTLIEIMIVVVILGILASTVLPQFGKSQESAQEAAMITSLTTIRSQIELYRLQHGGTYPDANIVNQLTQKTNFDGSTTGSPTIGPYIVGQFPANPLNQNLRTVKTTGTADDSTGWLYNTTTGAFTAGNTATNRTPYSGATYGSL